MSLGEWLSSKLAFDDTRKFLTMLSLVHWGAPPGDVSLFNVLRYIRNFGGIDHMLKVEGGDQQDRIEGTAHGLVSKFAEASGVRILLNAPVERITTAGTLATVEAAQHRIECRYVIVTASPMHRAGIQFVPTLPDPHDGLARSWRLGALRKAFVAYPRPFWRDDGLSGQAISDDPTIFLTFDVSPAAGGPNPAVGPKAWTSFGPLLREPVGLVHWAGTETADEHGGTMNGAILSGQRAAVEVAARLEASAAPGRSGASDAQG